MADKKVSTLTNRDDVIGTDLVMIVGDNATVPANYKVTVKNFVSRVSVDLANTEQSGLKVTANVVSNSAAIQAAAEARLNVGNTAARSSNAYGLLINHTVANTSANAVVSPIAFFGLKDQQTANVKTTYLFDIGVASNVTVNTWVTANLTGPNSSLFICKANTTTAAAANSIPATHQIKCRINGVDYWLLASNVAPA